MCKSKPLVSEQDNPIYSTATNMRPIFLAFSPRDFAAVADTQEEEDCLGQLSCTMTARSEM